MSTRISEKLIRRASEGSKLIPGTNVYILPGSAEALSMNNKPTGVILESMKTTGSN